ncbi:hypothetical protein Tco_0396990 [Tanacetum coccineum]
MLLIPLPTPSTSRRADIPKADTPPRKRILLTAPRPGCEVGESSAAAAARQPGPTMTRRVDCSSVDTVDIRSRESSEFYSRHHDAQKDRAAVRAEIEVLRRERLAYEQESMETRQSLARSEAYSRIRGRTQARPTLQAIVTGNHTPGLNLCVPSVITIMKVLVHLGAITAKRLAIWPRIVEADLQMLTTTTATTTTATTTIIIRREMVAMSAELKDTLKETAQN